MRLANLEEGHEVGAGLLALDPIPPSTTDFRWLIEAPGQRYLATRRLGVDEFFWTQDHNLALAFRTQEQANGLMMAVRAMDRSVNGFDKGLFAFEATLGDAKAVEHGWMANDAA